jgi:hypothetical protein
MPKRNAVTLLLDEIDAMCAVFVGGDAKGEPWVDTKQRIERLYKLSHDARRALERQKAKA